MDQAMRRQHTELVTALQAGEQINVAGYQVSLIDRGSDRLIVQFLVDNGPASFTEDVCEDDEFSQMSIVCTGAVNADSAELASFFEVLAESALMSGFPLSRALRC